MTKSHPFPLPKETILVTGGAGYIGRVLIEILIKKGYRVRVMDIKPLVEKLSSNLEWIQSDIRKFPEDIFKNVSAVIHLAALSNETLANSNPTETKDINVNATINLAKKAKKAGVSRFIFASSSSIYDIGIANERGEQAEDAKVFPDGKYSISKYEAEKELLALSNKNFTIVILRKATVCGYSPNMRFDLVVNAMVKNSLEKGYIKVFCKGLQWRPLINVGDVAQAYYKILTAPKQNVAGQIFNIGFGNFQVGNIALLIQKTMAKHFSLHPKIIYEQDSRKDRSYRINVSKAKYLLGFSPKITIEEAIIDLVKKLPHRKKVSLIKKR